MKENDRKWLLHYRDAYLKARTLLKEWKIVEKPPLILIDELKELIY